MSEAQKDDLWSWDYKKTKSEATMVLYRHYIYMEDQVTGILSYRRPRQCVSKLSMG